LNWSRSNKSLQGKEKKITTAYKEEWSELDDVFNRHSNMFEELSYARSPRGKNFC